MKINKKAQGLSLNVIIIAALALIVLVVLVAIFTGQIGGFGKGTQNITGDAQSCNTMCVTVQGYKSGKIESNECGDAIEFKGTFNGALYNSKGVRTNHCCCKK